MSNERSKLCIHFCNDAWMVNVHWFHVIFVENANSNQIQLKNLNADSIKCEFNFSVSFCCFAIFEFNSIALYRCLVCLNEEEKFGPAITEITTTTKIWCLNIEISKYERSFFQLFITFCDSLINCCFSGVMCAHMDQSCVIFVKLLGVYNKWTNK